MSDTPFDPALLFAPPTDRDSYETTILMYRVYCYYCRVPSVVIVEPGESDWAAHVRATAKQTHCAWCESKPSSGSVARVN